jgi:hypothetical protein
MSDVSYHLLIQRLAEQWQLSDSQAKVLHSLGETAVPKLLKIDTTLKQLFANSPMLADLWMTTGNKAFFNDSPMELIEREGPAGLEQVMKFLCLER